MTDMLYNTQGIENFQVETYLMKENNLICNSQPIHQRLRVTGNIFATAPFFVQHLILVYTLYAF